MDGKRFDLILTSLYASTSRRRTLGGVLAAALTGLARADVGAAKRACKKKCGPCERCRQGKCRRKPNGARCGPKRSCQGGVCRPRCGGEIPCFVFVSSSTHSGNLAGLAGADRICQRLADRANLPGAYKAWLSDTAGNTPNTRFRRSNGFYFLIDGSPVADSYAGLTDLGIGTPIRVTENGMVEEGSLVWTNTRADGTGGGVSASASCRNWTSDSPNAIGNVGVSNQNDPTWTASTAADCNELLRLYCVQQA